MPENDIQSERGFAIRRWPAWLAVPLVFAVAGPAAWLLTVYVHAPIVAAWLLIATIGWTLHRFGRANGRAVILGVAAALMVSVGVWGPTFIGPPWDRVWQFLGVAGYLFYLVAGIAFLMASRKDRSRCAGNCAGATIVLFSLIISAVSVHTTRNYRAGLEAVQETRQMILTLHRLTAEIEAIHAKTGRLPADEAELVALRGKPMPEYHRTFRIAYDRPGANSYRNRGGYHLQCSASHFWGEHWDFWAWIFHFYGPDAVERVYVETF